MKPFSLENKAAVVFGGAGYIGSCVVRDILALDGKVVVADISEELFDHPRIKDLRDNPNCVFTKCSVSSVDDIRAAYDLCLESFGFFNAMADLAVYGKFGPIETTTDEDIASAMEGVMGQVVRVTREVIPYFEKDGGVIVHTSSMYGIVSPDYRIYGTSGQNNPPVYGMGKAGVINFTGYTAAHLAKYGIRVNCVAPGPIPDPVKKPPPEFVAELNKKTMLGRIGQPEEMSGAFIYLLSDMSSFTTGECIVCDGGWTKW